MVVSDEEGADENISCGNRENTFLSVLLSDMENMQSAQAAGSGENSFGENSSEERQDEYISLAEAASRAFMSRQAISRYAEKGCFKFCRVGRKVRISRNGFERWLATRQEELMKY
jgi:excisionase family DNA binding protein